MPHISVPAAELNTRLDRLRCAMTDFMMLTSFITQGASYLERQVIRALVRS